MSDVSLTNISLDNYDDVSNESVIESLETHDNDRYLGAGQFPTTARSGIGLQHIYGEL